MNQMCIYQIVNKLNNKLYIGSAVEGFTRRTKRHLTDLRRKKHHNRHLQNAYNLYGESAFVFSILEETSSKTLIIDREQAWIDKLNPEYNILKNVRSHIGIKRSDETKKRMSIAQRGKKHTAETKEKIRQLTTGVKQSKETIQKRVEGHFNHILQCDREGNVIKEWKSATHAATENMFNRKSIYACLWGTRKTHRGFIWKKKIDT